jgi:uncharacterized protein Veg
MTVIDWNPLVNNKFSLDGDYSLEEGNIETLEFESGKKRTYSKNSYVPTVYPSIGLVLNNIPNNTNPMKREKTEYQEFMGWFNVGLRYGILPFYAPRIGFKKTILTKTGEIGIYTFIPNSLKYDKLDGIVYATFGLKEEGFLPEVEYRLLGTEKGKILLADKRTFIVV